MNNNIILNVVIFLTYILFQVLLFNKMILFDKGIGFIYLGFLLTLPFELGTIMAMLLGFLMGIIIDVFSNTLGIHASSSVFLMYLRPYIFKLFTPQGGASKNFRPLPTIIGFNWFFAYSFILIFLHHFLLFILEAGGFYLFGYTLQKIIISTLFTSTIVIVTQYLFSPKMNTL